MNAYFKALNSETMRQPVIETVQAIRWALRVGEEVHWDHCVAAKCRKCNVKAAWGEARHSGAIAGREGGRFMKKHGGRWSIGVLVVGSLVATACASSGPPVVLQSGQAVQVTNVLAVDRADQRTERAGPVAALAPIKCGKLAGAPEGRMTVEEVRRILKGGRNLQGRDLSGLSLVGLNFQGTDLNGANLRGTDLRDANLRGACLERADLRGADLRSADLSKAWLYRAVLEAANLGGAILEETDLSEVKAFQVFLAAARAHHADFRRADLAQATLIGADLTETRMTDANLVNVDLSMARLRGANMSGVVLRGAKAHRVSLSGVDVRDVDVDEADLTGTNLRDAQNVERLKNVGTVKGAANGVVAPVVYREALHIQ